MMHQEEDYFKKLDTKLNKLKQEREHLKDVKIEK